VATRTASQRPRRLPLDVVRVGDPPDLPLASDDATILLWAEREQRILISRDEDTLPTHLATHLEAGRRSPGVFFPRVVRLVDIVDFLVCVAYASEASEWENRITFIP
jgi:hypothetical protein